MLDKNAFKIYFFITIFLSFWFAGLLNIRAESTAPQVFLTWKASTYVPPLYNGKALPTARSFVSASFEVVRSGKIVDLSGQTIYWYLNDDLLPAGSGKQSLGFLAPAAAGAALDLRVEVPDFNGLFLTKTVSVPVISPEAVIVSPFPDNNFSGASLKLRGVPYFFNVTDSSALSYGWSVNGEAPPNALSPRELTVNINPNANPGSTLTVGLTIQNPANADESAAQSLSLTLAP